MNYPSNRDVLDDNMSHIEKSNFQSNEKYLKKIKKQAKRLFEYVKNQNVPSVVKVNAEIERKIVIDNLAAAQEIIAITNGYPNWHALEKHIMSSKIDSSRNEMNSNNDDKPFAGIKNIIENSQSLFPLESNNNLNIFNVDKYTLYKNKKEGLVSTFFQIKDIKSETPEDFLSALEAIYSKLYFQFSMGFNDISITLMRSGENVTNKLNSDYQILQQYNIISLSKSWNMSPDLVQKLCTMKESKVKLLEYNKRKEMESFNVLITLTTSNEMLDEHIMFCDLLIDSMSNAHIEIEEKKSLTQLEYDFLIDKKSIYPQYSMKNNIENEHLLWNNLFSNYIYLWPKIISLLLNKKQGWDININVKDKSIQLFYEKLEKNNIQEKYINGIFNGVIKTVDRNIIRTKDTGKIEYDYPLFNYERKISLLEKKLPWTEGIGLVNQLTGSINYYNQSEALKYAKHTFVYGKPGSGKSTIINTKILDKVLSSDIDNIPFIGLVDIGPNSKMVFKFIKDILPIEKRDLVQYHCIDMAREYTINPFDTPLGCRMATMEGRHILINLLSLIATDLNKKEAEPGILGLIQVVIEDMYMKFSEKGMPKRYDRGVDKIVDEAIKETSMKLDDKTTWWEIVDYLFIHKKYQIAMLAQRHAVPLLSDAISSTQDSKIIDIYSKVTVNTGETLIQYFNRMIGAALNQYKILTGPTIFDLGDAKVVCLDLNKVAKAGGVKSQRETSVMYMITRNLLIKNINFGIDRLDEMNYPNSNLIKEYKKFHEEIIQKRPSSFHLYLNEFHRVDNMRFDNFSEIISRSRLNLETIIASQNLKNFESFRDVKANIFMSISLSENEIEEVKNIFNLQDIPESRDFFDVKKNEMRQNYGRGVGRFISVIETAEGKIMNNFKFELNTYLGYIVGNNSMGLLDKIVDKMGFEKTLSLLCSHYSDCMVFYKDSNNMIDEYKDAQLEYDDILKIVSAKIIEKIDG